MSIKNHEGRFLLKDFSFALNQGDKIALIGEEGNGKSTLLKLIYNNELVETYVTYFGSISRNEQIIGYLPQYLDDRWLDIGTMDFLFKEQPASVIKSEQYNDLFGYYRLATQLKLNQTIIDNNQSMKTLSGGERIKVQLLKILYTEPDILLLDEPTNDLDLNALEWLEDFLINNDKPLLFISHDEILLSNVANGIIHMEQLKKKSEAVHTIVRIGYQEYIKRRSAMIMRDTMIANKDKEERDLQMEKWRRIYQSVDHKQATVTRQDPHKAKMLKRKMHTVKAIKHRLDKQEISHAPDPEEAINIFFGDIELPTNRLILDFYLPELQVAKRVLSSNIRLTLKGPKHVLIIGDNGTGKTTLLKKIYEQLIDTNLRVGYMAQDYEEIMDVNITPLEYITNDKDKNELTKIRQYLGSLKFTVNEVENKIKNLSGGQKAKLALLKLVYQRPQVLLLDEPTRNLSPLSNPAIRKMLSDYQGCLIAISHDRMFIRELADEVYELKKDGLWQLYNYAE